MCRKLALWPKSDKEVNGTVTLVGVIDWLVKNFTF